METEVKATEETKVIDLNTVTADSLEAMDDADKQIVYAELAVVTDIVKSYEHKVMWEWIKSHKNVLAQWLAIAVVGGALVYLIFIK